MADIARAMVDITRTGIEETFPPAPPTLRDQGTERPRTYDPSVSPARAGSSPSQDRPTISAKAESEFPFIPHRPPAVARPAPARCRRNAAVKRSTTTRNMMIAALTAVAVISAGAYLGLSVTSVRPPVSDTDETARLPRSADAATRPPPHRKLETVTFAAGLTYRGTSRRSQASQAERVHPAFRQNSRFLAAAAGRLKSLANRPGSINDASGETAPASGAIAGRTPAPRRIAQTAIATNEPAPDVRHAPVRTPLKPRRPLSRRKLTTIRPPHRAQGRLRRGSRRKPKSSLPR
jgi:hypothetical protein